jgi:hypothetical protein
MPPKKKAAAKKVAPKKTISKKSASPKRAAAGGGGGAVAIEACKSWGAFKTRATRLEKALAPVKVAINPQEDRPRKGVFCVTVGGTVVFETGPEPRPFPKLKAIDIDEVVALVKKAL